MYLQFKKNEKSTSMHMSLKTSLVFYVLLAFSHQSTAQVFSSSDFSGFAYQSIEAGILNASFDSKSGLPPTPGLSNSAKASNFVFVYFSPSTEIRLSLGKTKEKTGNGKYFLGHAGYLIHNFTPMKAEKSFKVPLSILSDFTSWQKKGEINKKKFEASSIGIQTGVAWYKNFESVQLFFDLLAGAGFGMTTFGYETGSEIRYTGKLRAFFPSLVGATGISVGILSEIQNWDLGGDNGKMQLHSNQITMGVCW